MSKDQLQEQIQDLMTRQHDLAVKHYREVLDSQDSLIRASVMESQMEKDVDRLTMNSLPKLKSALQNFQQVGKQLLDSHKQTTSTIELHAQLVDLLSIPLLMDTCARSAAIDEALELYSFAKTLRSRHHAIASSLSSKRSDRGLSGFEIVDAVVKEVEQSAVSLRRQLIQQLRGAIDLSACLRIVSYLKRLDAQMHNNNNNNNNNNAEMVVLVEDIRYEFLFECRDFYLKQQLAAAAASERGSYAILLKTIQKSRELWFDIITQYEAVFGLNEIGNDDITTINTTNTDSSLLSQWIAAKVFDFVKDLETGVSKLDTCGELSTVLDLSLSFAQSMAGLGADFSSLLPPCFLYRVKQIMHANWNQAALAAKETIAVGDFGEPFPSVPVNNNPSTLNQATSLTPPLSFLEFPVVVEYVNSVLRSFNDLRLFTNADMYIGLAKEFVNNSLEIFVQALENYKDKSNTKFQALCKLVGEEMIPFLFKGLQLLFNVKVSAGLKSAPYSERVLSLIETQ